MWGRRHGANLVDTPEMDAFFESLTHADAVELLRMRAAWQSIPRRIHEEAWAAVRAVGVRYGISKEIERVRNRAMAWAARGTDAIPYALSDTATWAQIKLEAEESIVDIALGIALGDRLDKQTRATLLAAWDRAA
ncbi:MAG: hypothetical protein ABSE70_06990 [Candidatus Limnocylindrales bacterium]